MCVCVFILEAAIRVQKGLSGQAGQMLSLGPTVCVCVFVCPYVAAAVHV